MKTGKRGWSQGCLLTEGTLEMLVATAWLQNSTNVIVNEIKKEQGTAIKNVFHCF